MDKNRFSVANIIKRILKYKAYKGVLIYSVFCLVVMCILDQMVPFLSIIPNRISGEIWFSTISSWLLAIPSIVISAYALIQTEYFHDLEEKRFRPGLWMDKAELMMRMINWGSFEEWVSKQDIISEKEKLAYDDYRKNYGQFKNLGILNLKAALILKSGDSVEWITFSKLEIQIGNQKYILYFDEAKMQIKRGEHQGIHRSLRCDFKNGQEIYEIEWMMDSFSIDKQGKELKAFWNNMNEAIVAYDYDVNKQEIEWKIVMKIGYGIDRADGPKDSVIYWKIKWDGNDRTHIDEYTGKRTTQAGIFYY